MKLLKNFRFICVLFMISTLFIFSCKNDNFNLETPQIPLSQKLSNDKDFNLYLTQLSIMQDKLTLAMEKMTKEERMNFCQTLIKKSKTWNDNDIEDVSKMMGYSSKQIMIADFLKISKFANSFMTKYPELREQNQNIVLENGISNSQFATSKLKNARTVNYAYDWYGFEGEGKACKSGYGACLVKSWGFGTAALVSCTGLLLPPVQAVCMGAVFIGTMASYAECAAVFCPPDRVLPAPPLPEIPFVPIYPPGGGGGGGGGGDPANY